MQWLQLQFFGNMTATCLQFHRDTTQDNKTVSYCKWMARQHS